uniref:WW domain-containing protein n=1 Tax=Elaeophora elaphi TaxID=1147741 RepID=A0A0R3RXB5_9BILA
MIGFLIGKKRKAAKHQMTGIMRTNPSNCSTFVIHSTEVCDASLLMADIPEDVKLEQLLELREQLREQIDQLNANGPLESSSSMRKIPKYRHPDRYQARKAEKRSSSCTVDGCANDTVAKVSVTSSVEDERNEQPGCSGMMKKQDEKDHSIWVQDILTTYCDNQCPFRRKSGLSSDITGVGNGPKKSRLHVETDEIAPKEVPKAGTICTMKTDNIPMDKMEEVPLNTLVGNETREDVANNVFCVQTGNIESKRSENSFTIIPEKLVPLPPPPPPPPPTPPLPPPPPQHQFLPSSEMNSTRDENILEEQQSEEAEERSRSLSRPAEDSGSELNGIDGQNNKNGKDAYLSDEDDGEDIDLLLEKPVEDAQTGKVIMPEDGEVREKIVLAYRGTDYFDVLPEGWVEVTHSSGLPIYLHKSTRVCTFSRPYFIGPGSVRHHNVPISAIPCLHQRRVLKEIEEGAAASAAALQNALSESVGVQSSNGALEDSALVMARLQAPGTKVQTAEDFKERQLDTEALHDYAKAVFKFKKIQTYRFNKWAATRNFHRQRKLAEAGRLGKNASSIELSVGRPALPSNVKLITVPALEANLKPQHRGFFLNPQGKTSVSVLHEYVQKVLKSTINYHFSETRNSSMPYGCTARLKMNLNNRVLCATSVKEKLMLLQEKQRREQRLQEHGEQPDADFVVLGTGCGNSKKTAKLDAARNALKVLIPDVEFDPEGIARSDKKVKDDAESDKEDAVALFDMLPIEDSRIFDLSARAGQPSPYLLLQECLKRNAAYGDTEIKVHSVRVKHQRHQFDMDVGKHRVSVICANKREGKQKASQAMLKKLHPNLDTWGSLIRLYGHGTQQKQQEARKSRQSIIKLQGNRTKENSALEPNNAILEKLRMEMLKLSKSKQSNEACVVPKRPKLSATSEPVDEIQSAQTSADYAAIHPDALSALRIDL